MTGFFAVYVTLFLLLWYVLMTLGLDAMTAFSAVSLSMTNTGPGLGDLASNFTSVSRG